VKQLQNYKGSVDSRLGGSELQVKLAYSVLLALAGMSTHNAAVALAYCFPCS
jgi:hypothetical protein